MADHLYTSPTALVLLVEQNTPTPAGLNHKTRKNRNSLGDWPFCSPLNWWHPFPWGPNYQRRELEGFSQRARLHEDWGASKSEDRALCSVRSGCSYKTHPIIRPVSKKNLVQKGVNCAKITQRINREPKFNQLTLEPPLLTSLSATLPPTMPDLYYSSFLPPYFPPLIFSCGVNNWVQQKQGALPSWPYSQVVSSPKCTCAFWGEAESLLIVLGDSLGTGLRWQTCTMGWETGKGTFFQHSKRRVVFIGKRAGQGCEVTAQEQFSAAAMNWEPWRKEEC